MFLALDIGNSAVKGGLFDGEELVDVFSMSPADDVNEEGSEYWEHALRPHLRYSEVEQIGVVSVVPSRTKLLQSALQRLADAPITVLHPNMSLPFELGYETPDTLGIDRLAAAAAGWVGHGEEAARSVLVVDAGTAINYELIHRNGTYLGGAIGAGPSLAREALRTGTAQLPEVALRVPDGSVGASTRAGLQSGIMWGFVDSTRGMVRRLARDLPDSPTVVLTGGWSAVLADHLSYDEQVPDLVLRGVRLLTLMNPKGGTT